MRQRIEEEREKQAPHERVTFLIVDDTNSVRRPSTKRTARLDYHYAHAEGKPVWSHVVVTRWTWRADLHSVTVKEDAKYLVYDYEGALSDTENMRVLLCWDKTFDQAESTFSLLSTDSSLDLVTILKLYAIRWQIETGYRYLKDLLGFDEYPMWSYKSVERYWCIQYLTYAYLECKRQEWSQTQGITLGDTVRHIRMEHLGNLVVYVYQQALNHMPLYEVLAELKLTA